MLKHNLASLGIRVMGFRYIKPGGVKIMVKNSTNLEASLGSTTCAKAKGLVTKL
jgi:hypothetical protein